MNQIESRAVALQIAAQMLGPIPKGSDLESESTYKDYLWLAGKIDEYTLRGGTILEPQPPEKSSVGAVPYKGT